MEQNGFSFCSGRPFLLGNRQQQAPFEQGHHHRRRLRFQGQHLLNIHREHLGHLGPHEVGELDGVQVGILVSIGVVEVVLQGAKNADGEQAERSAIHVLQAEQRILPGTLARLAGCQDDGADAVGAERPNRVSVLRASGFAGDGPGVAGVQQDQLTTRQARQRVVNVLGTQPILAGPSEFEARPAEPKLAGQDRLVQLKFTLTGNLEKLGIELNHRVVDFALYQQRLNKFEFDITSLAYAGTNNPGQEFADLFGSKAAVTEDSGNLAGVSSPAVDAIIARMTSAKTKAELLPACRALDRVITHSHYLIPQWTAATHRMAFNDQRLAHPAQMPPYATGENWAIFTWWAR